MKNSAVTNYKIINFDWDMRILDKETFFKRKTIFDREANE
jgi:hypothetical protein